MLSASHNPYEFNGIKIFGADGFKLTDEEEEEIEAIVLDHAMEYDLKSNADLGTIRNGEEMVERYIDHIASSVQGDLSGIKIAADCANGSASATAAKIFGKLGAQVTIPTTSRTASTSTKTAVPPTSQHWASMSRKMAMM